MKKKITVSTAVTLIILTAALTISITMLVAMRYFNRQVQVVAQRQAMYTHINEVDQKVREYYNNLDEEALRQSVTAGYVKGVGDSYAAYYTPAGYADEMLLRSGYANDVGVGVWNDSAGRLLVYRVNQDSAAAKAGVKVGDVVTAIDNEEIGDRKAAEIQKKLDTSAKVLLSVTQGEKTVAFELSAFRYALRSVQESIQDNVGYVKITAFYDNTPDQFKAVISYLLEQGVSGIIFDLRNNKGGSVEAASQMLSRLMPLGSYATVTDTAGKTSNLTASVNNQFGISTVTLVNESTAGEAELFAGVLQEFGFTTVVGETTAGKAKYQAFFPLESDGSAIKLTVGELGLLKTGSWEGTGIVPTQEVRLSALQKSIAPLLAKDSDPQYRAAMAVFATPAPQVTTTTAATSTTTSAGSTTAATTAK